MDALAQASQADFETRTMAHLRAFAPHITECHDDQSLRAVIRTGIAKANRFGFDTRGPVRLVLEIQALFGSGVDDDPQHSWVPEILGDCNPATQRVRAQRLFQTFSAYYAAIVGPANRHLLDALHRLSLLESFQIEISREYTKAEVIALAENIYPEKARAAGNRALDSLYATGVATAGRFGLAAPRQVALLVFLELAFGHRCCDDPFFPWIAATLTDPHTTDPDTRAESLEHQAMLLINRVLAADSRQDG